MSSVDDRVVRMQFQNSTFERAAQATLNTLGKLKASLNFKAKDPLGDIEKSSKGFSLGNVTSAIEGVTKKLGTLRLVGIGVLTNLATKAISTGTQMIKSLTIQPILAGYKEYETQLNSVQTILANTKASGATLTDVNSALNVLNHYADKTIYNFSEMTRNIGTFTAAGVDLKTAVGSIKGIANLAALSGSNAQQASTAMYQLSQAISAGRVGLQDWNSVVNAGMGGTVFQRALAQTAQAMGTLKGHVLKLTGPMKNVSIDGQSFRNSITAKPGQTSWLTGKVLTTTLKQFSGDLSTAQLKAIGFKDAQIKAIQAQAKTAQDAATKVKTFSQLMDTLKEAVGSGWTQTFQTIFGNFTEAKKLWTGVYNVLGRMVNRSANARNKMLKDWKAAGGRSALIKAIGNAFDDLMAAIKPIKQAFRDIFPRTTGKQLADMTKNLRDFLARLKIGPETADKLRRVFRGLFAAFDIGKQIIGGVLHVLGKLFSTIFHGSGGMLDFAAHVGDLIVNFDKALKKGGVLNAFFDKLAGYVSVAAEALGAARNFIFGLFNGWSQKDANDISSAFGRISDHLGSVSDNFGKVKTAFSNFWQYIQPGVQKIVDAFQSIGSAIANAFHSGNFGQILKAVNTGLLVAIAVMIRKFFKSGVNIDVGGGIFEKLNGVFEGLTGHLQAMQQNVKADTLLKIAAAVGILAASAVALATVDPKKLTPAMAALAAGFAELLGAMKILTGMGGFKDALKLPVIAAAMDMISVAIGGLVLSVIGLAHMDPKKLQQGLGGFAAILGAITVAMIPLSKNSAGLVSAGIGLNAIAVAMGVMFLAVKGFSTLKWGELGRGLAGVAGSLVAIAGAMRLMPTKGLLRMGPTLLAISAAMLIMSRAVQGFARMDWETLGRGLTGLAGSLAAIVLAMRLMPAKTLIAKSAALVIVSSALLLIGRAMAKMGGMSWKAIARGMTVLAGSLAVLVIALNSLDTTLPGAAALLVTAGALRIFVPVMKALAKLSWGDLLHALAGLAGVFVVVGAAGLLLAPVVPALLGLGAAMVLVGAGFALFGAGALAVAAAIGILATAGEAGIAILIKAFEGIIHTLPDLGKNLAMLITNFIGTIAKNAPAIVGALVKVLGQLLDAVVQLSPKMANAIVAVVHALLTAVRKLFPELVRTGFQLLMNLLTGIRNNIGRITRVVSDIIVNFLEALGKQLPRIINAGFRFMVKFLNGLADAIRNNMGDLIKAAGNVGLAIIQGLWDGIKSLLGWVWGKISGFFGWLWDKILGFFGIHSPSRLAADLGGNIIKGLWNGIKSLAGWIWDKVTGFFGHIWDGIKNVFSHVWDFGKSVVETLTRALTGDAGTIKEKVDGPFLKGLQDAGVDIGNEADRQGARAASRQVAAINRGLRNNLPSITGTGINAINNFNNAVAGQLNSGANGVVGAAAYGVAQSIVNNLHNGLKIQSPSKEGIYIGDMLNRGLAKGIEDNMRKPVSAAMRISEAIVSTLNTMPDKMNPTITPVLDLSEVHRGVKKLGSVVPTTPIKASMSLTHAKDISISKAEQAKAKAAAAGESGGAVTQVKFEQNNYSPKALSTVDIYRQTNNQIAMAKRKLGIHTTTP